MDASDRARAFLKDRFPKETDGVMVEAPCVDEWAEGYKTASAAEAKAKAIKEDFAAHLKGLIGAHLGASGPCYDVTWKAVKDTYALVTDYEALLQFYAEKHGFNVDSADIQKFTQNLITRAGGRRLNVKTRKEIR